MYLQLKLVNPSAHRIEHLVTQMKWRLEEGQGEAIYEIGVEDNGLLVGLAHTELNASMHTLQTMADRYVNDVWGLNGQDILISQPVHIVLYTYIINVLIHSTPSN